MKKAGLAGIVLVGGGVAMAVWLFLPREGAAGRRVPAEPRTVAPPAGATPDDPTLGWATWRSQQLGLLMRHPPDWTVTPAAAASRDGKVLRLSGLFAAALQSPQAAEGDPFGRSLQVDLQLHIDVTTATEDVASWYQRNHPEPEDEKTGLAGLFRVPAASIAVEVGPFEVPAGPALRKTVRFAVPAGPDAFAIDKNEYFVKRGRDVLLVTAFVPHGAGSGGLLRTVDRVVATLSLGGPDVAERPSIALDDYLSADGRDLMLLRTGVTDDDLAALAEERFRGVVSLSLAETPITDGALRYVRALPLEVLALSSTAITDDGLPQLKGLPLRHLMLARTGVTDAGLVSLKEMPLTVLDLRGTGVSDAGVDDLTHAIPELHVIR